MSMSKGRTIRMIAKILALLAIGFVSLFAMDAFGHDKPFWIQIRDFLMHMIPSFILLIIFLVALKRELVGGILFMAVAVLNAPWIFKHNYAMNGSVSASLFTVCILLLPFFITGLLFLIYHFKFKAQQQQ